MKSYDQSSLTGTGRDELFLTNDEKRICESLRVSEEEYVKARGGDGTLGGALTGSLTATEIRACELLGVSEKEYLKARDDEDSWIAS